MVDCYKSFPPKWNNIRLPVEHRSAALAGVAMYAPCTSRGEWVQRAAWALVSLGGPRLLPGRSRPWRPPLATDEWHALLEDLADIVGRFDSHSIYLRPDDRQGLLLLLLDEDRPIGLVKARPGDPATIDREEQALLRVERASIGSFQVPRVLGSGIAADWRFLVMSPMPPRMHRVPPADRLAAVVGDIEAALSSQARPDAVAADWAPCHGDFAPWNLRRLDESVPWLLDWENVGWAPPGADWVFYRASSIAIGRPVGGLTASEGTEYWRREVAQRIDHKLAKGSPPDRFEKRLLAALTL